MAPPVSLGRFAVPPLWRRFSVGEAVVSTMERFVVVKKRAESRRFDAHEIELPMKRKRGEPGSQEGASVVHGA